MPFSLLLATTLSAGSAFFWKRHLTGAPWEDLPRADRHHRRPVSRAGGAAWLTGFTAAELAARPTPLALLFPVVALAAFLLGRADDGGRAPLRFRWPAQTLLLVATALLAGLWLGPAGISGAASPGRLLVVAALCLATQTALQIFDNLDAALALAAAGGFLALAWGSTSPELARAAWAGAGASLGLLLWNRPPARLFFGNSGSQAVAVVLSALLWLTLAPVAGAGRRPWWVLLPLAWVLFDFGFVVLTRIGRGQSPWQGGRDHTTHRLARRLGSDGGAAAVLALAVGTGVVLACSLLRGSR